MRTPANGKVFTNTNTGACSMHQSIKGSVCGLTWCANIHYDLVLNANSAIAACLLTNIVSVLLLGMNSAWIASEYYKDLLKGITQQWLCSHNL